MIQCSIFLSCPPLAMRPSAWWKSSVCSVCWGRWGPSTVPRDWSMSYSVSSWPSKPSTASCWSRSSCSSCLLSSASSSSKGPSCPAQILRKWPKRSAGQFGSKSHVLCQLISHLYLIFWDFQREVHHLRWWRHQQTSWSGSTVVK